MLHNSTEKHLTVTTGSINKKTTKSIKILYEIKYNKSTLLKYTCGYAEKNIAPWFPFGGINNTKSFVSLISQLNHLIIKLKKTG